jgi:hypothetical protein
MCTNPYEYLPKKTRKENKTVLQASALPAGTAGAIGCGDDQTINKQISVIRAHILYSGQPVK